MHMMAWTVIGSERKGMEGGVAMGDRGTEREKRGEYPSWAEQKKKQQEGRKDESEEAHNEAKPEKRPTSLCPHFLCVCSAAFATVADNSSISSGSLFSCFH